MVTRTKSNKAKPKPKPKEPTLTVNPPGDVGGGTARYLLGDVFDALASLPDNSVDLVVTSPPFLNLRSYLPDDHPDKDKEIGRELNPATFLDSLLQVTTHLGRVVAPHGSIVVELGDTYSGGNNEPASKLVVKERTVAEAQAKGFGGFLAFDKNRGAGWPQAKSLCGVPTLYAWSLAYGRNLLNPQHEVEPWIVRNVMVWCKPSAPTQQLRDKFRASSSFITIATQSPDRYFDLFGVLRVDKDELREEPGMFDAPQGLITDGFVVGAPPKDYLVVSAKGFGGAHYATYPAELIEIPVDSMCPPRVCCVCGEPSRRVIESVRLAKDGSVIDKDYKAGMDRAKEDGIYGNRRRKDLGPDPYKHTVRKHVGWTDCGHDAWRNGVVLDPFAGSGTTLAVATGRGRNAIGIDVDERNIDMARERVGPMLFSDEKVSPQTNATNEEDLW